MNLYSCQPGILVRILEENPKIPVDSPKPDKIVFFSHLDGMYSVCENANGSIVHLAAWTEVEPLSPRGERKLLEELQEEGYLNPHLHFKRVIRKIAKTR